jgi:hypothetical protein
VHARPAKQTPRLSQGLAHDDGCAGWVWATAKTKRRTTKKIMTNTEQIIQILKQKIDEAPDGISFTELVKYVQAQRPDFKINMIYGAFDRFRKNLPPDIYRPGRGVYENIKFKDVDVTENQQQVKVLQSVGDTKVPEKEFYEAFAQWLIENEGCTKAIALGGNCFKGKWGTPDVLGVRKSAPSDIIRVPEEIVAGEVKVPSSQPLIEAFGQACSYKLFCHKSYIVVPKNSSKDDIERLDALARIFGIGLVLFDSTNPVVPDFSIRVRAAAHSPDIFFVNEKMKIVEKELFT